MFVFSVKHAPFLFLSPRVHCSFIKGEFVVFAKSVDLSSTAQKMNSSFCSGCPPPPSREYLVMSECAEYLRRFQPKTDLFFP